MNSEFDNEETVDIVEFETNAARASDDKTKLILVLLIFSPS